ncbi:penicillin-insensitive murein endopeptidase [Microbaculum marinum]|uniref:Penicillin-insensitive murein endopeptidase n=1 Tax=Microbaculum marinum TaxID=1764581 RepID=A0AAW9RRW0_9HYPH
MTQFRSACRPSTGLRLRVATVLTALACLLAPGLSGAGAQVAKDVFGSKTGPAPLQSRAIGSYARGCLAGAAALPVDGPAWQAMRLSRNRNWGHPELVRLVEQLAVGARSEGWNGLLVGDLAQPRGGPMLDGHASHQIGLDADIWLTPMPNRTLTAQERESISATSMLKDGVREVDPNIWTPAHAALIRRAAKFPQVARIFVHPAIKKALCDFAGNDRDWLRKVRPWWGHHYHFHIRISCPAGSTGCVNQAPPPAGDGCGSDLAWWLSDEPWKPADGPVKPKPPMTMADLPQECRMVADVQAQAPVPTNAPAPRPNPLPRR